MPSPLATAIAGPTLGVPGGNPSFNPTAGSSSLRSYSAGRFSPWGNQSPAAPATSWAGQQSGSGAPDQPPMSQPGQPGQQWQQNGQPGQPWRPPVPAGPMPIGQLAARTGYGNTGLAGGGIAALGGGMSGW